MCCGHNIRVKKKKKKSDLWQEIQLCFNGKRMNEFRVEVKENVTLSHGHPAGWGVNAILSLSSHAVVNQFHVCVGWRALVMMADQINKGVG